VQAEVASDRTRSSGFEKEDSDARPVSQVEGVVETSPRRLLGGKKRPHGGPVEEYTVHCVRLQACISYKAAKS
jgi:hypothetical protein